MRKIIWFSLSLGLSFVVFAIVAVLCVFLSGIGRAEEKTENESTPDSRFVLDVMVLFVDEPTDRYLASVLCFDINSETVLAKTVDCSAIRRGKTLAEIYKTEGIYPFASACAEVAGDIKLPFVKLNSNTFVIIADRLTKMVYNNKNNEQILLTSRQAEAQLNAENFSDFCIQVATAVFERGLQEEFLFVASVTENDLSYPRLHSKLTGDIT